MKIFLALTPLWLGGAVFGAFCLGLLLAAASGFPPSWPGAVLQFLVVGGLYLAAAAARQAFVQQMSGGPSPSRLAPHTWHVGALGGLLLAGLLLAFLQWSGRTGDLTLPLGALGVLTGYFLYAPPVAWLRRGAGEFWAGLGLGLLPVATGYYLQSGHFISEILLYGLPLSLSGFNVFLLLGFPSPGALDPPASGGLAARLSPVSVALIYTVVNILLIAALVFNVLFPAARGWSTPWIWALIALAVVNQEAVKRRAYLEERRLGLLMVLTVVLHLGMNLVFAGGLLVRL